MRRGLPSVRRLLLMAGMAGLTACAPLLAPPEGPAPPPPQEAGPQPSPESRALARYYERVQASLLAQGLLRTDGGGPDVPFDARRLAENFIRIALYDEYTNQGGRLVARETASRVHRWEKPIRMQVEFGATVPERQRRKDRADITRYAARLSRLTGVPIRQVTSGGNFNVFVVNEDERRALGPRLREILPGINEAAVRTVTDMPRSTFCLVFAWEPEESGAYSNAVAVIRAEHPDLMRLSCIHEELAQGMGLSNDSPKARPSIFNDDEEFALLTRHDELLLQILYDRRLRVGMTEREARPIVEQIAAELLGGES